jgi:hypothetical protein
MELYAALTLTTGLLVPVGRAKDEEPKIPAGPPPLHAVARMDKQGTLVIRQTLMRVVYRQEQRPRPVNVGGQPAAEVVTVRVATQVPETRMIQATGFQAFDLAGKRLEARTLPGLLKGWTDVLVSADGKMVDPFYLRVIREGTPVLIVPGFAPEPTPPPRPGPGGRGRRRGG